MLLSAHVERVGVSRMRDFFQQALILRILAYYMSGVDIGAAYVNAWHR